MITKKNATILLIIAVCISAIIFSSLYSEREDSRQEFEKAADGLYYLLCSEGDDSVDRARSQFQNDFKLSDQDMEEMKQLSAEYYFAESDSYYAEQNGQDGDSDRYSEISKRYYESVLKKIKDKDKFIQWMSDFEKKESAVQN